MAWSLVTKDTPFPHSQFVDVPRVEGWMRELERLVAITPDQLRAMPYRDALSVLESLGRAVSAVYLGCDLPATADPAYGGAWIPRWNNNNGGRWFSRAVDIAASQAEGSNVERMEGADFRRRVWITPESRLDVSTLTPPPEQCSAYDACADFGFDYFAYKWNCPGFMAAGGCRLWVLPAGAWLWELYAEVARAILDRGWAGLIAQSRAHVVATNLATAEAQGLDLPEELVGIAGRLQDEAAWSSPTETQGIAALFDLAAAAGGATPIGIVAGIAALFLHALGTVIPMAVGTFEDWAGRVTPTYEYARLSGSFEGGSPKAPTHAVPNPPGWREPFQTPIVYLPPEQREPQQSTSRRRRCRRGTLGRRRRCRR